MHIESFQQLPILGIIRGVKEEHLEQLIETVIESGLKTIEITMNTPGAAGLIRRAVKKASGALTIGAGTVLTGEDVRIALDAGATFIVSPVFIDEVVGACLKKNAPVFPGALTPDEIYRSWMGGAAMVKVFPSSVFGPGYFREIKAPFQDVKLLACGGVTPENLSEYFGQGADAVSFGSGVFKKEWLVSRRFDEIGKRIKAYVTKYQTIRNI